MEQSISKMGIKKVVINNKSRVILYGYLFIFLTSLSSFECNCFRSRMIIDNHTDTNGIINYSEIKESLKDSVIFYINNKVGPYYSKEYDSATEVFIDTVLINNKHKRVAFLVITKNSNDKYLSGGDKNNYHFDAHCFIGLYDLQGRLKLKWLSAMNVSRYPTLLDAKDRIRHQYFVDFKKIKNKNGSSYYKYNLNEINFWAGPVWKMYFSDYLK